MLDIITSPSRPSLGNVTSGRGFSKLRKSMRWSYQRLSPFRMTRKKLIDTYTGGSYGDGGDSGSVPINLLELAVSIYQRQLASHTPQVTIEAKSSELKPVAAELTLAVNHTIDKLLDLGTVLNEWVVDAMFALGIIKIGEMGESEPRPRGFRSKGLYVFADCVGLEDWVHDMAARRYEDVEYAGHMYDCAIEDALENPEFTTAGKNAIWSSVRNGGLGVEYGDASSERPQTLASKGTFFPDEYVDKVVLWEVWCPRDGIVQTFAAGGDEEPLRVVDWTGPETGPFHLLGFSPVPGNVMPVAPAMLWEDLMDLVNRLFLKIADQADRQRTILAGQNRTANAMAQITRTADGETVLTDVDPNLIKEFALGGVDGNLMGTFMQMRDLFSYISGNIDALGGLAQGADTLGQDRMIRSSASERLADYQQRVVKGTSNVVRDIGWYLWNNDDIELPLAKPITPTITRDFKWTRFSKSGEFFDYNFKVVPHSLLYKSPQEKLQTMVTTVNQTVIPMMELMIAQGTQFDVFKYLEHVARLSDVEELNDLIKDATGVQMNDRQAIDPVKSPVTQRTYTRQSQPASATPAGKAQQTMAMFSQGGAQPSKIGTQGTRPGRPPGA